MHPDIPFKIYQGLNLDKVKRTRSPTGISNISRSTSPGPLSSYRAGMMQNMTNEHLNTAGEDDAITKEMLKNLNV